MDDQTEDEVRTFWNEVAEGWRVQVGEDGDVNRRFNSDPVVWHLLGDVNGRRVLDAGCGTGYLTKKLHERGATAVGVDLSNEMIRLAGAAYPELAFRVDSISILGSIDDASVDLVVANYVLMDTPDLRGAVESFHRVLSPGGAAVVVFSHPCFPQGRRFEDADGECVHYTWDFPYFQHRRCIDPPWGHFEREFIWFHRPLSDYWKAFTDAGFSVERFEEPRITPDLLGSVASQRVRRKLATRPYSVAFRLRKGS